MSEDIFSPELHTHEHGAEGKREALLRRDGRPALPLVENASDRQVELAGELGLTEYDPNERQTFKTSDLTFTCGNKMVRSLEFRERALEKARVDLDVNELFLMGYVEDCLFFMSEKASTFVLGDSLNASVPLGNMWNSTSWTLQK